MPYYKCIFVDDDGKYRSREIFADNKEEIWNNYQNSDEKLLKIKKSLSHLSLPKFFSRKISYFDFVLFNQKLITLLKSGVPFIKGLEIILRTLKKGTLKEVISKTDNDIKNGVQVSDAFSSNQIPFKRIYSASLLAGERSGDLEGILGRFNIYIEKVAKLRRKVISSLSYPTILFLVMVGMVLVILIYAIPKFASFYEDFDADLPGMTVFFIDLGNYLQDNFIIIVSLIVGVYVGLKLLERMNPNIIIFDRLKLRIPFIGKIIVENAITVFSRTLAILISGGIPVPEATEIAVGTFNNKYFIWQVRDVPGKIREGNQLSDVLDDVKFIPPVLVEVIRVGESSGNLTDVLNENADAFENSIDAKVNSLISMIEPILIVCMGIVIAFMLVSVYLPIFNTVNIVH
ncbi:MAG: type II secretion system F family protein [bacterium]|nr:type II secretion system F family protein [bacterium]